MARFAVLLLALLPAVVVPLVVAAYADRRRGGRGPWPGRGRLLAKRKISRRMAVFGPVPGGVVLIVWPVIR